MAVLATYTTQVSAMPPLLDGNADRLAETAFIGGVSAIGVLSLCAGFVSDKIPLIILRALSGIGEDSQFPLVLADNSFSASSMTIPSALTLLVNVFPDPLEQARAIGLFGGCGGVGNGEDPRI